MYIYIHFSAMKLTDSLLLSLLAFPLVTLRSFAYVATSKSALFSNSRLKQQTPLTRWVACNVHSWQMPQSNSLVIKRLRCINIRWSEVNIKQNWLTIISACHERRKEASELPAAPHTDRLLSLFDDKLHGALVLYLYAFSQLAVYSQENLIACFKDWHPSWRIKRVQKACLTFH